MDVTLKIRGIYATALTRFFMDKGLSIVFSSKVIAQRFGDYRKFESDKPVDVEISDTEDGQGILLKGQGDQVNHVVEVIREAFFDSVCRKTRGHPFDAMEVQFPYLAKAGLDELRNRVVPTVFNHHRLRLIDSEYLDLMETKDLLNHPEKRQTISRNLENRLIWETYKKGKEIAIDHVKLNGRVISLSEGQIVEANPKNREMILKRPMFKGKYKYDGLNIEKKEGDYAITRIKEKQWFYKHSYFRRDAHLIGEYYNINTFIEFYPDKIRYVDLEIDVVRWPDGKAGIIDEELLNRCFKSGFLSEELKEKAIQTAHELHLSAQSFLSLL